MEYFQTMSPPLLRIYIEVSQGMLGGFIFMALYGLIQQTTIGRDEGPIRRFVARYDKYSYDIYLTHHIFILGPITLLHATSSFMANVLMILTVTLLSAVVLHSLSGRLSLAINGLYENYFSARVRSVLGTPLLS